MDRCDNCGKLLQKTIGSNRYLCTSCGFSVTKTTYSKTPKKTEKTKGCGCGRKGHKKK